MPHGRAVAIEMPRAAVRPLLGNESRNPSRTLPFGSLAQFLAFALCAPFGVCWRGEAAPNGGLLRQNEYGGTFAVFAHRIDARVAHDLNEVAELETESGEVAGGPQGCFAANARKVNSAARQAAVNG